MVGRLSICCRFICITLLVTFALNAVAADIAVRTDRAEIGINESFVLIFEATGKLDEEPDFSPLQTNFTIQNTSQSSNISIINGSMSRTQTWTLYLFPKKTGVQTIPAISFGKDKSPELQITVSGQSPSASKPDQEVFLEAKADNQSVYVQQQLIYTLKLYTRVDIAEYEMADIQLSHSNAVIKPLGQETQYTTTVANIPYRVIEKRVAIFPQTSGRLTIEPTPFAVKLRSDRRQGFFNFDPFNTRGRIVRGQSPASEIDVKNVPASYTGSTWLPATSMQLKENWSPEPPDFKVGEPVTRSLTLTATGLTAAQLPELSTNITEKLKQYPDQPSLQDNVASGGIDGTRVEKLALIPTRAGQYVLPAVEIPWWNTLTQKQELTRLPRRIIEVNGDAIPPEPTLESTRPLAESDPIVAGPKQATRFSIWHWLSLSLALLWLATLILWWRYAIHHDHRTSEKPGMNSKGDPGIALKRLRIACRDNDPQAAKQALIQWARLHYTNEAVHSLDALSNKVDQNLSSQIRALNEHLYRQNGGDWMGKEMWQAFESSVANLKQQQADSGSALEPLHKIQ